MIVLDTNVISELARGSEASPQVLSWARNLRQQPVTTVINRAEIMSGIALLPAGHRRDRLARAATEALDRLGICLPLVPACAGEYAGIVAARRRLGRPIGAMDALIAAITRYTGSVLATRDVTDFEETGVELVNPWG